jgi:MFS family permease
MHTDTLSPPTQPAKWWLYGTLGGLFVSNAGTFLQLTAQAWFLWATTHNAVSLGLLSLVQATPLLGLPLLGGLLADRFARRSLLLMTQGLLAGLAALIGVLAWHGNLSPAVLIGLAGLLANVAAVDNPVRQVYLPGVVGVHERGRIVGLNALAYNAGAVIGPAAAGLLLARFGASWCFLLNALSYLLALGWFLLGPAGQPVGGQPGGIRQLIAYFATAPSVRSLLLLVAAVSFFGRSYPQVLSLLVTRQWGGGASAYGLLAAVPGISALMAAGLAAWWLGRAGQSQMRWAGAVLLGGAMIGLGVAPSLLPAGFSLLVVGLAATGTMTLLNASLQITTPDGIRGRVLSLYTWLAAGVPALGGWLLGTMMAGLSPAHVLMAAGVGLIVVVLILRRFSPGAVANLSTP